jgi:hypothetical protein
MIPRIDRLVSRGSYRAGVNKLRRQCAGIPAVAAILKSRVVNDGG